MSKADKAQALGPQPAPRATLTEGHQRPYHSNPARPGQGDPAGNPNARHQLAQGQYTSPSRVPGHGVAGLAHLEHGITEQRPTQSITLTATAAHPENAAFQGADGKLPTATVRVVNGAEAATSIGAPSDFRAVPHGAMGMHREPGHVAPINGGMPVQPRPSGPAAVPFAPEQGAGQGGGGGILQGHAPHVAAPGAEWSTPAPGDSGMSRFGRGRPS